jgi:hypothetical protein
MPETMKKGFFDLYYSPALYRGLVRFYLKRIRSRATAERLFGMRLEPVERLAGEFEEVPNYFNISTLLLRQELRRRCRGKRHPRLLEIGVGAFALLSGSLSRDLGVSIDATDISEPCVASAKRHVAINGVAVRVFQSDLFKAIERKEYDVVFWNLPYEVEPSLYLPGLFPSLPPYLAKDGELLLAYNTRFLSRARIEELLAPHKALRVSEVVEWWWNVHEIMVIRAA